MWGGVWSEEGAPGAGPEAPPPTLELPFPGCLRTSWRWQLRTQRPVAEAAPGAGYESKLPAQRAGDRAVSGAPGVVGSLAPQAGYGAH